MTVTLTLSDAQVAQVVHEASDNGGLIVTFAGLGDPRALRGSALPASVASRCSRAVLQALIVLAAFPTDGSDRELTTVARELAIAPGTMHRYATTWMAVGLLEQDPRSRRYRRTLPPSERQPIGGSTGGGHGG